ncbi:MAG: hypothetical protein EG826_06330 [Deltaproteobacteria bacterium]|nr:hypothetical protein [Deltaproteobacteria bacterium]
MLSNAFVSIPAGAAGTYYTILLTTPFVYNGEESLVVEVQRNACTGTVNTVNHDPAAGTRTVFASDTTSLSGTAATWFPDTKFGIDGGDSAILYSSAGANSFPFGNTRKIQLLYTAAAISGSGAITGIGFPVGNVTTTGSSATATVTLGHTSLTGLSATYADNFNSGTPVVVTNARTFTIPAGIPVGKYIWIPIPDGAFSYNGTDNLVVQIETTAVSGVTWWMTMSGGAANTRVYGNPGDTTGTPDTAKYFIKFRFAGAPVHFITGGSESDTYPFALSASGSKRQRVYRSSELGAKGTITQLAHRLADNAVAGTYDTLTVKLAHTDLTTLGTSFSANLPSATTVYTVTYSIPATLKAGDWIEIPLATPFAYNPGNNLMIEISNHSGNAGNINRGSVNSTLYPSRRAFAGDYTTDTAGTSDFLADFRLIVQ